MKLSQGQIQRVVDLVIQSWKKQNLVTFKVDEKLVYQRASELVIKELQKEDELDREVHKMLDDLERSNSGQFQRYKMFPLIKAKLAKEKKIIL